MTVPRDFDRFTRNFPFERSFPPEADGHWGYFPRGLRKPGYRVDAAMRERILEITRAGNRSVSVLIIVGSIAFIAAGTYGVMPAFAVVAVVVFVGSVSIRKKQRRVASILKNAATVPVLSSDQRGRIVAQSWAEASLGKKRFLLLCYPLLIVCLLAATAQQLAASGSAAHWLGVGEIVAAGVLAVTYLRFLMGWIRSTRRNSQSR
jgi:hypothetical protein